MIEIYKDYLKSIKVKKLEDALVDEILNISSYVRSNDLKLILHKLANSNNKIISNDFKIILNKVNKGHKIKDLFKDLKEKYNSNLLDKFLDLLEYSISSGTVTLKDYKIIVKDYLKAKELLNERDSVLLMQKYTIIFAGGLIVPGILGIVISLVKNLVGVVDISVVGLSSSASLYLVSYYCAIIYIIEYVIISSFYLAQLEDNIKKFIYYLIFLLPVSLLIFFIASYIL
jgi:hypothetical protein